MSRVDHDPRAGFLSKPAWAGIGVILATIIGLVSLFWSRQSDSSTAPETLKTTSPGVVQETTLAKQTPTPAPSTQSGPSPTIHSSGPLATGTPISQGVAIAGPRRDTSLQASWSGCSFGMCASWSDSGSIDGMHFDGVMSMQCTIQCTSSEQADMDVNLGRNFSTLNARLGVMDKSPDTADSVTIQLIDVSGGQVLFSQSLKFGAHVDLKDFNVRGVLRLRFRMTGPLGKVIPGIGDPTVYP